MEAQAVKPIESCKPDDLQSTKIECLILVTEQELVEVIIIQ
jgi:hypothetical protein